MGYNKEIKDYNAYSRISIMKPWIILTNIVEKSELRQQYQDMIEIIKKNHLYKLATDNFKSYDGKEEDEIKKEIINSVDEKYIYEFIINRYLLENSSVR